MEERIKALNKLGKIYKDIKEKNIQQDWDKAGYEHSLLKFHKPVIEKFEQKEADIINQVKALTDQINNLSLLNDPIYTPLALEDIESDSKKRFNIETDHDLDINILNKYELSLPSELINKPEELIEELNKTTTISKRLGPGTQLLWGKTRLNPDLTYKDWSKPINRVDEAAYHHDVCYLKNKDTKTRNEVCDTNMLKELDDIENPSIRERIERGAVKPIIKAKKRFGMGLPIEAKDSVLYCVKCKSHTKTKDMIQTVTKNNRPILKGICIICGSKKNRFLGLVQTKKKGKRKS
ncbi:hypothetical protein AVEN_32697-1 [Araneus ventricosus]|uniref:Uncharacterized protein n=1 Tax=Araneus ventricosus TaxID=182803 RepID=A0A4Y2ND85_ARAVE|nr:hypothetical protein AVEN_32697-1 [Araneus ventricosus]